MPPAPRGPRTTLPRMPTRRATSGCARGLCLGTRPRSTAVPGAGRIQLDRHSSRESCRALVSWTFRCFRRSEPERARRRIAAARARSSEPRRLLPARRCVLLGAGCQRAARGPRGRSRDRRGSRGHAGQRHRSLSWRLQGAAHQGRLAVQRRAHSRDVARAGFRGRATGAGALSRANFLARSARSPAASITRRRATAPGMRTSRRSSPTRSRSPVRCSSKRRLRSSSSVGHATPFATRGAAPGSSPAT